MLDQLHRVQHPAVAQGGVFFNCTPADVRRLVSEWLLDAERNNEVVDDRMEVTWADAARVVGAAEHYDLVDGNELESYAVRLRRPVFGDHLSLAAMGWMCCAVIVVVTSAAVVEQLSRVLVPLSMADRLEDAQILEIALFGELHYSSLYSFDGAF